MPMLPVQRALLSVYDKTGVVELAAALAARKVELVSTGGTAQALRAAGLPVTDVAALTGFPEMLDGRVKTLHPAVHGGILAVREDPAHAAALARHGIAPLDLVVINLYPFEATAARTEVTLAEAVEQIDIGGPAMLRSAAKNHAGVGVVVDPADYPALLAELTEGDGRLSLATRFALARKAFAHTARYDAQIAAFLERVDLDRSGPNTAVTLAPPGFPALLTLPLERIQTLRYGENPHQRAAFYRDLRGPAGLAAARQLQGKELSYNNLLDLDAAWALAAEFPEPAAVLVKHTNPCGVACAPALAEAYARARDADPVSAFGGILAVNRPLDGPTAAALSATFVEAVIAPGVAPEGREALRGKKNLRLLEAAAEGSGGGPGPLQLRQVAGGILLQEPDRLDLEEATLRVVTRRPPTETERAELGFAWRVAKHVKSNAIVLTRDRTTVGIGAGQMSRVDATQLARLKARGPTAGSVLASDAFFPFRDGVDAAAEAGVTAIIQPGGSVRDPETIAAADEHGLAMLFTGIRHFRH